MTDDFLPLAGRIQQSLEDLDAIVYVVRNIYAFNLNADRVLELTRKAPACLSSVRNDLHMFIDFIIRLNKVPDND